MTNNNPRSQLSSSSVTEFLQSLLMLQSYTYSSRSSEYLCVVLPKPKKFSVNELLQLLDLLIGTLALLQPTLFVLVIVIVYSRFLERPDKRSRRNQLIHWCLTSWAETQGAGLGERYPQNLRWGTAHASVPQYFEKQCYRMRVKVRSYELTKKVS